MTPTAEQPRPKDKLLEFEQACYRAYCDLFITFEEYQAAVRKYADELAEEPK